MGPIISPMTRVLASSLILGRLNPRLALLNRFVGPTARQLLLDVQQSLSTFIVRLQRLPFSLNGPVVVQRLDLFISWLEAAQQQVQRFESTRFQIGVAIRVAQELQAMFRRVIGDETRYALNLGVLITKTNDLIAEVDRALQLVPFMPGDIASQ